MEYRYIKNKARLWFNVIALLVVVGLVVLTFLAISAKNTALAFGAISGAFVITTFMVFNGDVWLFPDHIIMDTETEGISSINEFHCDPV